MQAYEFTEDWFEIHRESWDLWLMPWIEAHQPVNILELGSHEGRSSVWFAEVALAGHPDARLTCVDSWEQQHAASVYAFRKNIDATGYAKQVEARTGRTEEILPWLPTRAFDLIYIDAGHHKHEVRHDTTQALRLIKPGGWILWDDYAHDLANVPYLPDEVIAGVHEALDDEAVRIEIVGAVARWQAP